MHHGGHLDPLDVAAPLLALLAGIAYLVAIRAGGRRRVWPPTRTVCWLAGLVLATVAVAGPLGRAAMTNYDAHMIAHLALGMLAPVCLVLGAPVSALLRALSPATGRRVVRLLRSPVVRVITEPLVAAALEVGGLWVLYVGGVFPRMHESTAIHLLVHTHLLLAGVLFTATMISPDPMPHRRGHLHRAAVLVLALAAHDVLAKYLYAHPPAGAGEQEESGAMIMYYGGDAVDVLIMVLLGLSWYRATGRSMRRSTGPTMGRSGGQQRRLRPQQLAQPGQ